MPQKSQKVAKKPPKFVKSLKSQTFSLPLHARHACSLARIPGAVVIITSFRLLSSNGEPRNWSSVNVFVPFLTYFLY